jgi:hypothetical protein
VSDVRASQADPVPSARIINAPTGIARNRSRRSASAQTVISLTRPLGPMAALLVLKCAAGRVAATSVALTGTAPGRTSCPALRIMGSPVKSTVNDLLFTRLLRYGLESVGLEHCLPFFAQKVSDECRGKCFITPSENRHGIRRDNIHFARYVDDMYLIAGRRGV